MLNTARRAFVWCESDENTCLALRHQVRAAEEKFTTCKSVFYKREGSNKWLGSGKVVFQDVRLVFVCHGGIYVRVSTNRVIKNRHEMEQKFLETLGDMDIGLIGAAQGGGNNVCMYGDVDTGDENDATTGDTDVTGSTGGGETSIDNRVRVDIPCSNILKPKDVLSTNPLNPIVG